MAYREHPIGVLVRRSPQTAVLELIAVLRSPGVNGNIALLAEHFGVNYRTAARWIDRLEACGFSLRDVIREAKMIAKESGARLYRRLIGREIPTKSNLQKDP